MTQTLISMLILTTFISCGQGKTKKNMDRKFNHETIQSADFDRFILVKGNRLNDVRAKVFEWAEIFSGGEKLEFTYEQTEIDDWTLIKLPNDSIFDHYNYHNLVYWFLGTPPEDNNYADFTIGLSVDKQNEKTYLVYNDYDLRSKIATNDDVFGIFNNDEKFILSIPFDEFKETNDSRILDFDKFIKENQIDILKIKSEQLNYNKTKIEIAEQ